MNEFASIPATYVGIIELVGMREISNQERIDLINYSLLEKFEGISLETLDPREIVKIYEIFSFSPSTQKLIEDYLVEITDLEFIIAVCLCFKDMDRPRMITESQAKKVIKETESITVLFDQWEEVPSSSVFFVLELALSDRMYELLIDYRGQRKNLARFKELFSLYPSPFDRHIKICSRSLQKRSGSLVS